MTCASQLAGAFDEIGDSCVGMTRNGTITPSTFDATLRE
jgi:hypothetical protein